MFLPSLVFICHSAFLGIIPLSLSFPCVSSPNFQAPGFFCHFAAWGRSPKIAIPLSFAGEWPCARSAPCRPAVRPFVIGHPGHCLNLSPAGGTPTHTHTHTFARRSDSRVSAVVPDLQPPKPLSPLNESLLQMARKKVGVGSCTRACEDCALSPKQIALFNLS